MTRTPTSRLKCGLLELVQVGGRSVPLISSPTARRPSQRTFTHPSYRRSTLTQLCDIITITPPRLPLAARPAGALRNTIRIHLHRHILTSVLIHPTSPWSRLSIPTAASTPPLRSPGHSRPTHPDQSPGHISLPTDARFQPPPPGPS